MRNFVKNDGKNRGRWIQCRRPKMLNYFRLLKNRQMRSPDPSISPYSGRHLRACRRPLMPGGQGCCSLRCNSKQPIQATRRRETPGNATIQVVKPWADAPLKGGWWVPNKRQSPRSSADVQTGNERLRRGRRRRRAWNRVVNARINRCWSSRNVCWPNPRARCRSPSMESMRIWVPEKRVCLICERPLFQSRPMNQSRKALIRLKSRPEWAKGR